MDRIRWLRERRSAVEDDYTRDAPTYDDGYDPATPTHRRFVARLIETTPKDGALLDVACGTAPYAAEVLESGLSYVGVDQSSGMLTRARAKWPDARFDRLGLQELAFEDEFDAAMCIDAMEHVPPEDWPVVLAGLRRALKPGGHLYLTVEEIHRGELDEAFAAGAAAGLPLLPGEDVSPDTGGYHHYPDRRQVDRWLAAAGLQVIEEADEWLDGYGYHHMLIALELAP